jgi:DNA-binding NarL/FixJ family response regulator
VQAREFSRVNPESATKRLWQHAEMGRTVLIVDDHVAFRTHAAALLERAGYDVVGSCHDGRSALAAIAALRPEVVLLDVQLPDVDGFGVIAQLEPGPDGPTVVLVSSREAVDYGNRVHTSGAAGFISKAELSARSLSQLVAP